MQPFTKSLKCPSDPTLTAFGRNQREFVFPMGSNTAHFARIYPVLIQSIKTDPNNWQTFHMILFFSFASLIGIVQITARWDNCSEKMFTGERLRNIIGFIKTKWEEWEVKNASTLIRIIVGHNYSFIPQRFIFKHNHIVLINILILA